MKLGICPKCSSEKVYYSDTTGVKAGVSVSGKASFMHLFKYDFWRPESVNLQMAFYICQSCGYFESYVIDTEQLSKLDNTDNWKRVKSD